MTFMKKNRLGKTLAAATLSLSLLAPASLAFDTVPAQAASVSASTTASGIISTGKRFMGTRYQYGSQTGNTSSFDCSSFVQYVYKQNGINLPRSSKQQSQVGTYVPRSQLKPGDLVFFYSPIHHVAIYMGNGQLLHTYGSPGVTVSDLNSGWWSSHYTTARRVLPYGQAVASASPQPGNAASTSDAPKSSVPKSSVPASSTSGSDTPAKGVSTNNGPKPNESYYDPFKDYRQPTFSDWNDLYGQLSNYAYFGYASR